MVVPIFDICDRLFWESLLNRPLSTLSIHLFLLANDSQVWLPPLSDIGSWFLDVDTHHHHLNFVAGAIDSSIMIILVHAVLACILMKSNLSGVLIRTLVNHLLIFLPHLRSSILRPWRDMGLVNIVRNLRQ